MHTKIPRGLCEAVQEWSCIVLIDAGDIKLLHKLQRREFAKQDERTVLATTLRYMHCHSPRQQHIDPHSHRHMLAFPCTVDIT